MRSPSPPMHRHSSPGAAPATAADRTGRSPARPGDNPVRIAKRRELRAIPGRVGADPMQADDRAPVRWACLPNSYCKTGNVGSRPIDCYQLELRNGRGLSAPVERTFHSFHVLSTVGDLRPPDLAGGKAAEQETTEKPVLPVSARPCREAPSLSFPRHPFRSGLRFWPSHRGAACPDARSRISGMYARPCSRRMR